ncbi:hypothetical protein D9615_004810 [Tricholomella constricta]|uniref:Serine protease n=1 Tax=Tricholomella constricta TaxID=117010 RepID=A0A8H5HHH9_9AGAR|nr:hypothetical protein D9615_004810 [Tricholomella constricta]
MDDDEGAELERDDVLREMEKTRKSIRLLPEFLAATSKDWKERENRILDHVVLSPHISFDVREDGFMEDWAVIEIDDSKVDFTNFVGNVIDLGTAISIAEFMTWMTPHAGALEPPRSFHYPTNRLLELRGTVSDGEIWKDSPKTHNNNNNNHNDPYIMVLKRGYASGLTVGRLNTIRSLTKVYSSKDRSLPGQMSNEIAVLPRDSTPSGAFAVPGDSGSAVVDGKGRIVGLLNGGAGGAEDSDCTYVTSINFLLKRMLEHGLEANLSPSLDI